MIGLVKSVWQELQYNIDNYADPRTRDWLLVWRNPVYVWALTAIYLVIVFYGPKFMQNRKAFSLQGFLVVYNLGLVALSVYMVVEIILSTWDAEYNYRCGVYNSETIKNPKELRVAKVMWWYFFSKAIELLDTVLMVLRKKNNQITFLHWFHHASMLNIWWWVMMFIPGGQSFFGSCLNCMVHVVMYAYYGLAAIPSLRESLWWKRYITRFQLIQFCITLSHSLQSYIPPCDFPMWGVHLLVGYMVIMLILFSNFYYQTYKKKQAIKENAKLANGNSSNGNTVNGINGHATHKKEN